MTRELKRMEQPIIGEEYTTVPYKYKAVLQLTRVVMKGERSLHQPERMTIAGAVHPGTRDMSGAYELARARLVPLVDLGWVVVDFHVISYGEPG